MVLCLEVYSSFFVDPQKFFRMTRKIFQILGECAHVWIECVWQMLTIKIFHARLRREKNCYTIIDKTENFQRITLMSSSTFFGIERGFLVNERRLFVERASKENDDLADVWYQRPYPIPPHCQRSLKPHFFTINEFYQIIINVFFWIGFHRHSKNQLRSLTKGRCILAVFRFEHALSEQHGATSLHFDHWRHAHSASCSSQFRQIFSFLSSGSFNFYFRAKSLNNYYQKFANYQLLCK